KNQQLFNRLTKRIENLEKENANLNEKFSRLLSFHSKEITPLETMVAHARIQLAMALAKSTESLKFTQKQTDSIRDTLLEQCNLAFQHIEPTPEQEAFYNKWAAVSYKDDLESQMMDEKEMFADYMSDTFGFDIDFDDFDDSPEGQARFYAKMKDQFAKSQESNHQQEPKKTKRQINYENKLKSEEAIKARSLRSIFIALAKVLHPDTETNESLKSEKEEVMKKVTSAYDQKDLTTLLRLEMEWIHKTNEHLEQMTDDKLGIYISALKQQVKELEEEKYQIFSHPRNADVSRYSHFPENLAFKSILKEKNILQEIYSELNQFTSIFEWSTSKKQILDFVKTQASIGNDLEFDRYFQELLSEKWRF
ncbi:MAG: hypothetical protein ACOYN4_11685, partial [Bacteroidales bacterium]